MGLYLQAGNDTGILGGLSLRVIEVGGHGDDCALDLAVSPQEVLCNLLHLDQHHGRHLFGGERLVLTLVVHCITQAKNEANH